MPQTIIKNVEQRMRKALDSLKREFTTLRAGRANTSLLDRIHVDYYGTSTPIKQMANISTPDPRTILIQPWDKTAMGDIEKAIQTSDLGINPSNDGEVIRISLPMLTEERRAELVKVAKRFAEESKVVLRNIRRDANDELKKLEKDGISEDESRRSQEEVQKITDQNIVDIDKLLAGKEKEIMDV